MGSNSPKSFEYMKILQLSDIHWLCNDIEETDDYVEIREGLIRSLARLYQNGVRIDHVLICGDIAFKGDKTEYDEAATFIGKICGAIGCKSTEVYVVPGNHDKVRDGNQVNLRHAINQGLADINVGDDSFCGMLRNEPDHIKLLYKPFCSYADFATKYDSVEPLMIKALEKGPLSYENSKDKMYWHASIGDIKGYEVNLYGINTAFCSDENDYDFPDKGTHKQFLSKLAYKISLPSENCINIMMAHHPYDYISHDGKLEKELNKRYHIQLFGHVHQLSVQQKGNKCVHIFSGALQPPNAPDDKTYFPVYNILDISVDCQEQGDLLHLNVCVMRWYDDEGAFKEWTGDKIINDYFISLKRNLEMDKEKEMQKTILPDGMTQRDIKIRFLQMPNPKKIMDKFDKSIYDKNLSGNANYLRFLRIIEQDGKWESLYHLIKDK